MGEQIPTASQPLRASVGNVAAESPVDGRL